MGNDTFSRVADAADDIITDHAASLSQIIRFDDPSSGLHTSILYTCCHTALNILRIRRAIQSLVWRSFELNYTDVGCNVDMHGKNVTYLHAMPDQMGQARLQALAESLDAAIAKAGVPVHHRRQSLFHMTLARVTPDYPAADALDAMRRAGTAFGRLRLCAFELFGHEIYAIDGC